MIGKLILLTAIFLSSFVSQAPAGEAFYGSVTKIIDGDSLVIVTNNRKIEVRLYGVDAPEWDQPFSKKAKAWVRQRIYGRRVLVQPEYFDSYKRMVAIVQYDDQTLNGELVQAGLAWVYPRYCRKKICTSWKGLEQSAKRQKIGMWSSTPPVPPWQWKRMKREKTLTNTPWR